MPATIIDNATRLEDRFVSAFEMHEGLSLNGANAALRRLRNEAIGHFATLGFPARKAEAWKYTNIGKLLKRPYKLALQALDATVSSSDLATLLIPGLDTHVVVFVNGHFDTTLSSIGDLPEGVLVTSLVHAADAHADLINAHLAHYTNYEEEAFTALNTAFTHDGVFIYVPRHVVVEKPVHVISLVTTSEDVLLHPRHLIVAEENAHVKIIQSSRSLTPSKTFINAVTEVFVGPQAHVDRYEIQDEEPHTSLVTTLGAYQETGSVFRNSTFTFGGEIIRNNVNILPNAEHCETHLFGLFLADGTMHVDNHTLVDHAKPNCFSNEFYKGVLDDRATGVFNGKVFVREDAQQINAYQKNKSILLSDTASMYAKPELEIYADDVRCSHGATTGQLDEDALFYLRSRGLSKQRARALLLVAFARDVLDNVAIEALHDQLDAMVTARFSD